MAEFWVTTLSGLLVAIAGIVSMTGNISLLHRYHRHRVAEADIKPFGKRVGIGILLCGIACIFYGIAFLLLELTQNDLFVWVGTAMMLVLLTVGIVISFKAIIKYNKGLF